MVLASWFRLIALKSMLLLSTGIIAAQSLDSLLNCCPRVQEAAIHTEGFWQEKFAEKGVSFPPPRLFLRAYKYEKELEIWAAEEDEYQHIYTLPICMIPGLPGPKLRQGDKQVPEGVYAIDSLNPKSAFHLSLRVNYPNKADRIRSASEKDIGGDIFIHGDCYSVGCLPMKDEGAEAIFWLVAQYLQYQSEKTVPIHLFPFRMDDLETWNDFTRAYPNWKPFWISLRAIEQYFNLSNTLPAVNVKEDGRYELSGNH